MTTIDRCEKWPCHFQKYCYDFALICIPAGLFVNCEYSYSYTVMLVLFSLFNISHRPEVAVFENLGYKYW